MSAGEVRGPLPPGWAKAPIGELCELVNGRAFKPEEWTSEGLPIIRIQNLNHHAAKFNRFSGTVEAKHRVSNGDLLFAWSGTPGTSFGAHLWRGGDAVLNQHIFNVIHGPWVIRDYMRIAMNSRLGSLIDQAHGGAGLAHVTKPVLERTEIPIPPLAEQRRIVAKLDAVMAQVREARAALEAVPALLEQYRRAVLAAAFRGELTADWRAAHPEVEPASALLARVLAQATASGSRRTRASPSSVPSPGLASDLPATWTTTPLETLAAPVRYALAIGPFGSNLKTSDYTSAGVPLVFVRDIRARSFGEIKPTFVSHEKAAELGAHQVFPGDLVVTKMGDPPGDTAVYPLNAKPGIVTADCIKMTVSASSSAVFLMHWLESDLMREALAEETQGVAQQKVSLERFRTLHTRLPPLAEQHEIVRRVEAALGRIARVKEAVEAQRQQLDALERAVLDKAFRGALVPQHPDDEPAEAMLARLRAQRAAAGIAPKGRRGRPRGAGPEA